jgi:acetylornithine deacetylase/succinyl-diaminopimelate desuccinylase-like protein
VTELDGALADLGDWLRIPSVSTAGGNPEALVEAAGWALRKIEAAGGSGELVQMDDTGHPPLVVGELPANRDGAPTILIYGHYDVQPPEPLELWTSPPFEPTIRDGRLYARGSVDDKGQLYLHIKAIEAHMRTAGRLPVNVVVLAEGEEEVGSENLVPFIEKHAARFAADYIVVSDTTMFAPGMPTIGASLRGIAYFQIDVTGPAQDLHSGAYGGAVVNPATALARIIASFHDADWRVAIPGFYDDVDPAPEYREQIRALPFDDEAFRKEVGAPGLNGEAGQTTLERIWVRPTIEINGLLSGYTGEGSKTVLPSTAMAKVSCRLVPNQDPAKIARLVEEHVRRVAPTGVEIRFQYMHGGQPWRAALGGKLYEAAARALERAFGRPPIYAGEGGSIPIVTEFERVIGAPVLLMGFGLPGENAHAPDEWMSIENFEKGMHAAAALLAELG